MKNFLMTVAGLLACAAFAGPAGAQTSDTAGAEKFLRGVYAHYRDSNAPAPEIKDEDIYDAPLLALMAADSEAADGEVGYLDGDPMCDCQDYDIRDVRITFAPAESDQLKAKVSM